MKIRQSECKDGATAPVPIKVTWTYCNEDSDVQKPVPNMIIPKYKDAIKQDPRILQNVQPNTCVELTSLKSINFCKRGSAMSLKYEATIQDNPVREFDYCYAWSFLRVRKEWLPENPGQCAATVSPYCIYYHEEIFLNFRFSQFLLKCHDEG